jgi:hypothetical protein
MPLRKLRRRWRSVFYMVCRAAQSFLRGALRMALFAVARIVCRQRYRAMLGSSAAMSVPRRLLARRVHGFA